MGENDFRLVKDDARNELRIRAIRLLKKGQKKREVARIIGCHYNTVGTWWKIYKKSGTTAIKSKVRGRKTGEKCSLSPSQEKFIRNSIVEKMPDQLKLGYALWTRKAVKELVFREFSVKIALNTVGNYLNNWGFTPQKPKKLAYEQNPVLVKRWVEETYPSIAHKAKREGAEVHWGDETGVRNDIHYGRSYSPKGVTPVSKHKAQRMNINMISTVTNQGKVRFMTYENTMTAELFIDFLKRLTRGSKKKVFLILDNLKVHHSNKVKGWVEENKDIIELFFLPPYSPDRNPDEYLNCDLKLSLANKPAPKSKDELKNNVKAHMLSLQRRPKKAIKFFRHSSIKYAA